MVGRMTLVAGILAAAVAPAVAWGGGFATAGVSPPPPGTPAGTPWNAELTILQHGRMPLRGVKPSVIIRPAGGGPARTFAAKPTAKPGVYMARVVFPKAGRWTYTVDDGFSAHHEFAAVTIGGKARAPLPAATGGKPAAARADGGGIDVWLALGLAVAAGSLAGIGMLALGRRRAGAGRAATTGA